MHARRIQVDDAVNLRSIARGTPGFSGADLANLVNEAALFAARAGRGQVTDADLSEARDKVLMGVERRSVVLSEMDRVNCAYHEAGHAVVAALLPSADPLHDVVDSNDGPAPEARPPNLADLVSLCRHLNQAHAR